MTSSRLPVVAVVGRPNVGKSTLVNRLAGRQIAIVEARPGVTRDRLEIECEWNGRSFLVVDTGGVVERGDTLDAMVTEQALRALGSSDLVLLVLDATTGVTADDAVVARQVRRHGGAVIVVANKVDSDRREVDAWEFAGLGLGDPAMVSALHGRGVGDLLDEVVKQLPEDSTLTDAPAAASADGAPTGGQGTGDPAVPAVAIVGRPNVGKSTLFNRLSGQERSVVHDLPGTTRDAIDTLIETEDGTVKLIDTAGMRRRARSGEGPEYYSLVRALRALDHADVALLVLDATEGVTHQDQRLAERIDASGSPVVILLNKWDLLATEGRLEVSDAVADRLAFLGYAPVLRVSAKTGLGVHRLLPAVREAMTAYHRRIPTGRLNDGLRSAQAAHPAPGGARILYGVQGAIDPPTITLFATRRLPPTYLRYLERSLRERFELGPTPIELRVRLRQQR
ncbi:MAG TPA: ribosome biogenesis GTPase Der [Acidimicrobiales bacterium]|nr:ribosome biogenesis GTPase Der [Acidimicrobiales bacterium]